ncbi:MAG: 5-formyltetrahydrofolate cyclo-ligase [Thermoplasmata archaeon]|nr:5-formyltetrahydrofolate cyclo-ligase [Thermoplasmata archaeon]
MKKEEIRKKILQKRNKLTGNEILEKSNKIISKLTSIKEFKEAKKILCYVSFGSEVFTHGLIRAYINKKDIAVPVIKGNELALSYIKDWKELEKGRYGILEPKAIRNADIDAISLAIVPAVAFDERGYRIGYGRGYFDRLLARMNAMRIGLGYELQIVKKIPEEKHDVRMDMIITEERIIFMIEPNIL